VPFYKVTDNVDTIYAEDINQFSDALSGNNDVGQIKLFTPISPPGAPTVAVNPTAGNLTGNYKYAVAFVTGYWKGPVGNGTLQIQGNTGGGTPSASVSPSAQQVNITNIPTGPTGTVARILYRTKANGSTFYFLTQINDNTTTAYTDNTPDGSLGAQMPTVNTTGTSLNVGGTTIDPYGNVTIPSGKTLTLNGNFLGAYASNADVTGSISDLNGNAFAVAIAAPSGATVDPFGIMTGGGASAVKAFSVSRTNVVASKNNILDDSSGNAKFYGNIYTNNLSNVWLGQAPARGLTGIIGASNTRVWWEINNNSIPLGSGGNGASIQFSEQGNHQYWEILNAPNNVGTYVPASDALQFYYDGTGGGPIFTLYGNGNATLAGSLTINGSLTVNGSMPSVIKSIQRGTTTVSATGTVNVTISSVNTAKAWVNLPTTGGTSSGQEVYAQLTSSTNLAIVAAAGMNETVSWEVIEYY
jgi:uncharacterized glyoxalase superfamily protein PhnB